MLICDMAVQHTLLKESRLIYNTALDATLAAHAGTNDSKQSPCQGKIKVS